MLRTPTPRSGMPFFRPVESAARNLRPLSDHRLIVSPLLSPPVAGSPTLRSRVAGRSHALFGGVAVLAVAGALSASLGASSHAAIDAASTSSASTSASRPAAAPGLAAGSAVDTGIAGLLTPAAFTAPAAAPAALTSPALQPAGKSAAAAAKAQSPSLTANPHAPRGAAIVTHQDTVNVKAMSAALRKLRSCETGGDYREASGNGYYGAYQFDLSTWDSLGLSGYPSNASHQLQDVAVVRLEAARGWGPWPVCSYVAGLR